MLTEQVFTKFKKDFPVYGMTVTTDAYGSRIYKQDTEPKATIRVMWEPVTDEVDIQTYGVDVEAMKSAVLYGSAPIEEHDRLQIDGEWYEITSIKKLQTHRKLLAHRLKRG